eukprot:6484392-Amphidinium_carterae.1
MAKATWRASDPAHNDSLKPYACLCLLPHSSPGPLQSDPPTKHLSKSWIHFHACAPSSKLEATTVLDWGCGWEP